MHASVIISSSSRRQAITLAPAVALCRASTARRSLATAAAITSSDSTGAVANNHESPLSSSSFVDDRPSSFAPAPLANVIVGHLRRHQPSPPSSSSSSSSPTLLRIPNPLVPSQNPATGRWSPARLSGRVRSELERAIERGEVEKALVPVTTTTASARIEYEDDGVTVEWTTATAAPKSTSTSASSAKKPTKAATSKNGANNKAFKGRRVDRDARERRRPEIEARCQGMEERVEEWRKVSRARGAKDEAKKRWRARQGILAPMS